MSIGRQLGREEHEPSEAIEAPDRRNSSEPIWMGKTFSGGNVQVCFEGDDMLRRELVALLANHPRGVDPFPCSSLFVLSSLPSPANNYTLNPTTMELAILQ